MKSWPAIAKQLLAVAILSMATMVASSWAQLYCYYFDSPALAWWYDTHQTKLQLTPGETDAAPSITETDFGGSVWRYLPGAAYFAIWATGMAVYIIWARRSLAGLLLAAVPVAAFLYFSWQQLMYAYPVCNSF
jgi:hypothetical protein